MCIVSIIFWGKVGEEREWGVAYGEDWGGVTVRALNKSAIQ
jgi:hypothetical protein